MSLATTSYTGEFDPTTHEVKGALETSPGILVHNIGDIAVQPGIDLDNTTSEANRDDEVYKVGWNKDTFEVTIESPVTLEDFERLTSEDDWKQLLEFAGENQGKNITFINPTLEGGGVAMLRPPLVHLLQLLGVDAHWYVVEGRKEPTDPDPFIVTKMMHNISQRQSDQRLTNDDINIHWLWNVDNAEVLKKQNNVMNADFIVIDDPQPAPLMRLLQDHVSSDTKWIWRNHIDTDAELMADPTTAQGEVASYVLDACGIRDVDAVISHPVERFVHPGMLEKTYFAPATTDPFDDLNRQLEQHEIDYGISYINSEISEKNIQLATEGRYADIQSFLDVSRKRIVLVARFDESKGMDIAMELGVRVRTEMRESGVPESDLPQIVLVGNGSLDDPSGVPMYEKMLRLRREKYADQSSDIIIMRLKHNYTAMNALMYPTGGTDGTDEAQVVGIQTSVAEGCETRISDWIRHGVPAVVFNNGGMPAQVKEGLSGHVLDYSKPEHDLPYGTLIISELLTNSAKYARLRTTSAEQGRDYNDREYTTTANGTRFLRVMTRLNKGQAADHVWEVSKMAA